MSKPTVFISYSHLDEIWKDRLRPHLKVLEQVGRISIWDDRQIDPGGEWYDKIEVVMDEAAVTVCLISADYLASDFCVKEEIPHLLERRTSGGMLLIPILVRPCPWKVVDWLKALQMIPRDGKSVSKDYKENWDEVFAEVAEQIFAAVDSPAPQLIAPLASQAVDSPAPKLVPPAAPHWAQPEKVDIDRLPVTGAELFGRKKELDLLDQAWESGGIHVISFVAWGGVGKSTLVNKWIERMESDNFRGARAVYGWSFFSQGTSEKATSADAFISEALTWFGDADPKQGSPWDKGQRLAELVQREKTLLLLDGLEPLQSGMDYERGKVKDPALATLLTELAKKNPGLCVITTREIVADLVEFETTARSENLELLSPEAGRALLRVGGVRGTDAELEEATTSFGRHALALILLSTYLQDVPGHHISNAAKIPDVGVPVEKGKHPRRVIAAFEKRFGAGPEIEVLRILGLFDRPADSAEINALRSVLAIRGLTDHLVKLSEADWLKVLGKLRDLKLIAKESKHAADALDAHPVLREHFGQQLKQNDLAAWREGNNRLFEHLKTSTKEFPDTIEEMMPLFSAVAHGCEAGRYQVALDEIYVRRIQRGSEFFSINKLGAWGADLAVLTGFFDPPWGRPVTLLTEAAQLFVLGQAGFNLRAMGRLTEAVQPLQAALNGDVSAKDWTNAAVRACNLSELYQVMGEVSQSIQYAKKSVQWADRTGHVGERLIMKTVLAVALHRGGRVGEAAALYQQAEEMQKTDQSQIPFLCSLQGYEYCDLLLSQGKFQEVLSRAPRTLELGNRGKRLLDIALAHLSLGRAYLLQAQVDGTGDFGNAKANTNEAVAGLRKAGRSDHLPRGLLAQAELYRVTHDYARAARDLDEVISICARSGMRLYEADCHLGYARLYLAQGEKETDKATAQGYREKARESWEKAKKMVEEMGYGRRTAEVKELEEKLNVER